MKSLRTEDRLAEIKEECVNPLPLSWRRTGLDAVTHPAQDRWVVEAIVDAVGVLLDLRLKFNCRRSNAVLPEVSPVILGVIGSHAQLDI